MSLKRKAVDALFWSACDRFSRQGLQFAITIILARLLAPTAFGLIGMLSIITSLAQSFVDSGFSQALIQKQDADFTDECSVFYFNIAIGFLAATLIYISAPWISAFYHQPSLTLLSQALSLNLVFNSFGLIQNTLLNKNIDFKTLFKAGLGGVLVSGTIGIFMAVRGYGVWSLVAQSLTRTFTNSILLWFFNSWRPKFILSLKSLRRMFGFGSRLMVSGILDSVSVNIYAVVIGKLFNPFAVGCYTQSRNLQHLPVSNICSIVARVTFPVFSSIQSDFKRLKRSLRKALTTLVMFVFPLMVGLGILARPFVSVVLGEQWLPCVPYIRLLCVTGALWPLHVMNLNFLKSIGRSDLFFRLEILKKTMTAISIFVTYRWGVEALLLGQIFTSFVAYFINSFYTSLILGYSLFDQTADLLPYLLASIGMGVFVGIIGVMLSGSNTFLSFCLQVLAGVAGYYTICKFFGLSALQELEGVVKEKFQRPT